MEPEPRHHAPEEDVPGDRQVSRGAPGSPRSPRSPKSPKHGPLSRRDQRLLWTALLAAGLLIIVVLVSRHFDEFLRRTLETKINQRLTGYTVTLGSAHLSPLNLALTLGDAVIRQQAHPNPPVAAIPALTASVEWRELLRFKLVADAKFERPRVHLNLPQLQSENRDKVEVQDRGWQDALQSIYPLKFNTLSVREGDIVYVDEDPKQPLRISRWNFQAENIRNVRTEPGVYPSPIHSDGVVFGTGRASVDGHADFLAKPNPGIHATYVAEKIPLDRLRPFSDRANLRLQGGVLASKGEFEFGSKHREVRVDDVTVQGLKLDYLHNAGKDAAEEKRAEKVAEVAKDQTPETLMRIVQLRLRDSELGLVDRSRDRPYRVFLDSTDLDVSNVSAGFVNGPAKAELTGHFMGTGAAHARATFRADPKGPDFDLNVAIEGAQLASMNDLLRNYAKLDVVAGTFSLYSEMTVRNGRIDGYVKPLYKDVDVYDSEQDKDKPFLNKIYEKVVGGLSHLLDNKPRDEVATVIDISGPLDNPNTSIWDTAVGVLSNAFVKAILPGFQREFDAVREGRGTKSEKKEDEGKDKDKDKDKE
ncbi:MAG TPA: DUF748 domain-containing protein [Thermoanaerobaculia bacterium]|nr:DUF748 domain-containing protein [Thermoanaerobaculia bacterium]